MSAAAAQPARRTARHCTHLAGVAVGGGIPLDVVSWRQEKYEFALGQSPGAIALMEIDPLQDRFQSFKNCLAAKSWYQLLIRSLALSHLHP
jgi:hypothetical protein